MQLSAGYVTLKEKEPHMKSIFTIIMSLLFLSVSCNGSSQQHAGLTGGTVESVVSVDALIITDSKKELNRRIWTFSTSDIFYRKGFAAFDVTQEEYVDIIRELHPYAVAFPEGKTSDWSRQVIGDTTILGGRGNGYNIPSWVPTDILQGMSSHKFYLTGQSYDFFNAYVKMLHEIPSHGYVLGNIMTGTCAEVIWMISRTHPEYVQLGLEQMRAEAYSQYWKKDPGRYKEKFNRWADSIRAIFPHVKIIADVPPSHSGLASDREWIQELQAGLRADGIRDYWHLHWMSNGQFTGDIKKDQPVMDEIFTNTLPALIEKNKKNFPGKELVVDQWSVSLTGDGGRNPYKRTFFGTSYIPRMVHFMIEYNRDHNNAIASAKYENLKQLIGNKGINSMEYEVAHIMSQLFTEPATVLTINNQSAGIEVTGVKVNSRYKLIVFNYTGNSIQLPKQINCDQKLLKIHVGEAISSPGIASTDWEIYSTQTEAKPYSILYLELAE